mgnify:CR=1 FL=1
MVKMKVMELRDGKHGIDITVRVLEVSEVEASRTRHGETDFREAIVGDETGRVKLAVWGELAYRLKPGSITRITDAWTTCHRCELELKAGFSSTITEVDDESFPTEEEIPERVPPERTLRLNKKSNRAISDEEE